MIIFDSSPLIHLTKIGKIDFILKKFKNIIIPDAVYCEVIEKGIKHGYSDAILLENYYNEHRILKYSIKKQDPLLKKYLHLGEYESILLSETLKSLVILDDRKARLVAEQRKISSISTADMLLLLIKLKSINFNHFKRNLLKYSSNGWFTHELYEKYLNEGKKYE
ncbi:hypothetical protein DSAG12_01121 [Promethearchaeum syntrophicum]|uniref:PIN domain-containing protein n=1 Tax=Promethearchaeum syntrophicum TaxID=2594042 RepID=A0A5B9D9M1_9ARCH|nr:hypothetical protein [Candidatus Prometheoarchaeum syntrophicum]QEE15296.1 hypothetical protein DSAG12_01121 [Candidatus Prometheoarchaeum syntrophicum]